MEAGAVPEDWRVACIVPVYKGKGDRGGCANFARINILSKLEKIVISRVMENAK